MRLKPELKGALLALLGLALLLLILWSWVGLRLGIWTYHEYRRYVWLTDNLPVAHALWWEEIKPSASAETLVRIWHPHRTSRFGYWTEMTWYPGGLQEDCVSLIGVTIIAKDGILVSATSWSDDGVCDRTFFNTASPEDEADYQVAFRGHVEGLRAEQEASAQQSPSGDRLKAPPEE